MEKETIVDKDYLEGFNLGYELAKELNLNSPMFKNLNSEDSHMNAMQAGMAEYSNEMEKGKGKENHAAIDETNRKRLGTYDDNGKDKGMNLST
ncbi:hypothetical protein [Arenibacter certesii]|uniref:Uncharacterized protein n=1 Tax=Arenibacter certesii TaxID=228955 RepID=A0A918MR29_9FLAO|nr:hypothetical protein [Arenibacter certesii]GGW50046.1 hypothetical protein GCM10007383_37450 [Arenibacter certesii]